MKTLLPLLLLCSCLSISLAKNNKIRGIVKLQSSGSKPLADVKISAFGTNSVYSNSGGLFELEFKDKGPGSAVNLVIDKVGYEVINDRELENCVIREQADDLVIIVMARQGERNKQALAYYNIILENADNNYDLELQGIRERLEVLTKNDAERQVLQQKITALQSEKAGLLSKAEDLAKELASLDLDQSSALAQQAMTQFQAGNVQLALETLGEEQLQQQLSNAKSQLENAKKALNQGIENYVIKARLCISDRQYKQAYRNYLIAVEADSTNVKNLSELAKYCASLNQQKRAIRFYDQAATYARAPVVKASLWNYLANQYLFDNNFPEAERFYKKSLKVLEESVEKELPGALNGLARLRMNMGNMHFYLGNLDACQIAFQEALKLYSSLARETPSKFDPDLAKLQMNMAVVYVNLNEFAKAEVLYKNSIEIRERLVAENPAAYEADLAFALNNLGAFYVQLDDYEKAERTIKRAEEIYRHLSELNPAGFEPELALTQMNLAIMYQYLKNYQKSEATFQASLSLYQKFVKENAARFEADMAKALMNFGVLYLDMEAFVSAKDLLLQSLAIRSRLAEGNPERFEPQVADVQMNLGKSYLGLKQLEKADQALQESLEIRRRLAQVNPSAYNFKVSATLLLLGKLYWLKGELEEAEERMEEALEIRRRLAEESPKRFLPELCLALFNCAKLKKERLIESQKSKHQKAGLAYLAELETALQQFDRYPPRLQEVLVEKDGIQTFFDQFGK